MAAACLAFVGRDGGRRQRILSVIFSGWWVKTASPTASPPVFFSTLSQYRLNSVLPSATGRRHKPFHPEGVAPSELLERVPRETGQFRRSDRSTPSFLPSPAPWHLTVYEPRDATSTNTTTLRSIPARQRGRSNQFLAGMPSCRRPGHLGHVLTRGPTLRDARRLDTVVWPGH